ncbi:MAG: hypothetical protein LUB59_04855 [Candidatus Gastranaerophilales bacterium]|nr:hypothetical protein [Candidatus Gastranaerophilales bacterium]
MQAVKRIAVIMAAILSLNFLAYAVETLYTEDDFIFEDLESFDEPATPSNATMITATPANATPITATPSDAVMLIATPANATPKDDFVIVINFTNTLTTNKSEPDETEPETPKTDTASDTEDKTIVVDGGTGNDGSSENSESVVILPEETEAEEPKETGTITAYYEPKKTEVDKSYYYIDEDNKIIEINEINEVNENELTAIEDSGDTDTNTSGVNMPKTGDNFDYKIILLLIPLPVILLIKIKRKRSRLP